MSRMRVRGPTTGEQDGWNIHDVPRPEFDALPFMERHLTGKDSATGEPWEFWSKRGVIHQRKPVTVTWFCEEPPQEAPA